MLASLRDKILPLADDTVVLPGHGPATTIGRERATNPYLRRSTAATPRAARDPRLVTVPMSKPTPDLRLPGVAAAAADDRAARRSTGSATTFELYGFAPLETRAVEPLDQLLRKGETSKEVYVLRRLQADADAAGGDDALGLHFDLTVPFARYVLENAGKLQFPFRRYQIQKVWRGERPQEGRYREFLQADIDVVDRDTLPFALRGRDAAGRSATRSRGAAASRRSRIQVNNRKVCEGFYRGLGLADPEAALRAVDKLDKIGPDRVADAARRDRRAPPRRRPRRASRWPRSPPRTRRSSTRCAALGVSDPLLDEGLDELVRVVETAAGARARPAASPT